MEKRLFITVCAFAVMMFAGCEGNEPAGNGGKDNGTEEPIDNGDDGKEEPQIEIDATTDAVSEGNVWATHAIVSGSASASEGDLDEVQFGYRVASSEEWQYADATAGQDDAYSATIIELTPGTEYEVCIYIDDEFYGDEQTFTTEVATALPNGGFEDNGIYMSGSYEMYYFYSGTFTKDPAENPAKFWDTGNEGSITLNKNVTLPSDETRPGSEGIASVKLQSSFVGLGSYGKFAAGNLYSGDYAETVGMSGGKVDFGQPFTSRPSALKFWYKGTAGTVTHSETDMLPTGETDKYKIYIALTTWDVRHQVFTGDQTTFLDWDNDPSVVAYGELVGSEAVADWKEATIELEYRSLDTKPTYIVVVASASMYGDYFTGSTSSVLQIDDFELVYDRNIKTAQ